MWLQNPERGGDHRILNSALIRVHRYNLFVVLQIIAPSIILLLWVSQQFQLTKKILIEIRVTALCTFLSVCRLDVTLVRDSLSVTVEALCNYHRNTSTSFQSPKVSILQQYVTTFLIRPSKAAACLCIKCPLIYRFGKFKISVPLFQAFQSFYISKGLISMTIINETFIHCTRFLRSCPSHHREGSPN